MIQFTFSITLGFVSPNSSNHCTCQCIFIMYSYVCIMFYFCMRQIFFCHTKHVASVPSHHPKNSTTPHPILPLPYYPFPASPSPPQPTAGRDPPPHIEKKRDSFFLLINHPAYPICCGGLNQREPPASLCSPSPRALLGNSFCQ
jgi:hypothetical protein